MTELAPARFVLDSYAILAYHRDESGGVAVRDLLHRAADGQVALSMAVVNMGEVYYRTVRELGVTAGRRALRDFADYPVTLVDVDQSLAVAGALLKGEYPISYADCIAAALAQRLDAAVVTGDPDFHRLEHLVRVEWLPAAAST
jgi:ribonuclease VapC